MSEAPASGVRLRTDIVVIGAGQAGLSSAYHLKRRGLAPNRGFVVLDQSPNAGGAWQFRWPTLTLSTVNRIHDLPGMPLADVVDSDAIDVQAAIAVPQYYAAYEKAFELPVYRPVTVQVVCDRGDWLNVETNRIEVSTRGIINATGTWETPYIPRYPGAERFRGRQLHTRDYRTAAEFVGKHVVIVGGGISAIQLLDEISRVTTTTWVTRRPPEFRTGPFDRSSGARRRRNGGGPGAPRAAAELRRLGHRAAGDAGDPGDARARRARAAADVQRDHRQRCPLGERDGDSRRRHTLVHRFPQLARSSRAAHAAGA